MMEAGPSVFATGGGAFVQAETRALILEKGIAIWLDSDVATLVGRVARRDTRPLLRDGDPNASSILETSTGAGTRWTIAQRYLPAAG